MKAFEVSEIVSNKNILLEINGGALVTIKIGDWLGIDSNLMLAKVLNIIFWNGPIDEIEAPHACGLLLESGQLINRNIKFLVKTTNAC